MPSHKRPIRVLILGPNLSLPGGVAAIYRSIIWKSSAKVEYFPITPAANQLGLLFIPQMIIRFIQKVRYANVVQINPSLDFKSVVRDGFLLLISNFMKAKTIVFFHGWDERFEHQLRNNSVLKIIFKYIFDKADAYCLLGAVFREKVIGLGIRPKRVFYLPTVADDAYYRLSPNPHPKKLSIDKITILFLSRFDKNKGSDLVISTFQLLQESHPSCFELIMAGDGPLLNRCKKMAAQNNISDLYFEGFVDGNKKHQLLCNSDILFLPSLSEGLPCAIMEAMLYGLAIITRPIGGIPDWIKHYENGWLSNSLDARVFANGILSVIEQPELLNEIKENNRRVAAANFTPHMVMKQMQSMHNQLLK